MLRSIFCTVCICIVMSAVAFADQPARIAFRELQGTGLAEILQARRSELEEKKGEPLRGHEWWLWGLSAFDYDLDGDLDFIVCIHGSKNGLIIKNLWKETGEIRFADATKELGVDGILPSTDDYPLVWDFDGDGDLDIAGLLDDSPTPCLFNENGKRFVKAPFSLHPINHPGGVVDLNGDQYLDIFQVRRGSRITFHFDPQAKTFIKREASYEPAWPLPKDVADELAAVRARKENRFIKFNFVDDYDLDGDGRNDLVVSGFGSYSGERLGWYLLAGGDNRFADKTSDMGLPREGTPFHFQDVDQDGDVDLLVASGERAGLYINGGNGKFTLRSGPLTDFVRRRCPYLHVAFRVDFDNDGDLDLALSNRRYGQQRIFENLGNGTFEVALESRGWDADPLVLRDLNDDGRIDAIIGGAGEKENIGIFMNETPGTGNFCKLQMRMNGPNVYAAGAKVEIFAAGTLNDAAARPRLIETARLDGSPIHVGLGAADRFDMRVAFPGASPLEARNVKAQKMLPVRPDSKLFSGE